MVLFYTIELDYSERADGEGAYAGAFVLVLSVIFVAYLERCARKRVVSLYGKVGGSLAQYFMTLFPRDFGAVFILTNLLAYSIFRYLPVQ